MYKEKNFSEASSKYFEILSIVREKEALKDDNGIFDDARFIEQMGTERYIDFSEFAKIMSIFNPRTGIDENI